MGNIILPDGVAPEPEPEQPKQQVMIITDPLSIKISDDELNKAKTEYNRQSKVLVGELELRIAIQRQVGGWANWLAMTYPRLGTSIDSALKIVGYKLVKLDEPIDTSKEKST